MQNKNPKQQSLSPQAAEALAALKKNGRVRTQADLARLALIELKGFGLAIDPIEDMWELSERGKAMAG